MRLKSYFVFTVGFMASASLFAATNADMSNTTVNPASVYGDTVPVTNTATTAPSSTYNISTSTKTTTQGAGNASQDMNAASDGTSSEKASADTGIFTIANGQKCIPSCEGTYVINGQSTTALLFLKDARNALLVSPYESKDSLNYKQLQAQKNSVTGTWKPKDNGSIEFKSYASGKKSRNWDSSDTSSSSPSYNTRRSYNSSRSYNNPRNYNNYYNNDSYYNGY